MKWLGIIFLNEKNTHHKKIPMRYLEKCCKYVQEIKKELKTVKNKTKILELKDIVPKLKNSMDWFKSRLYTAKDDELEDILERNGETDRKHTHRV